MHSYLLLDTICYEDQSGRVVEWFSIECRKTKTKPITSKPIKQAAQSQTVVKPKPKPE